MSVFMRLLDPLLRSFSLPFVWEIPSAFLLNLLLRSFSLPFVWESPSDLVPKSSRYLLYENPIPIFFLTFCWGDLITFRMRNLTIFLLNLLFRRPLFWCRGVVATYCTEKIISPSKVAPHSHFLLDLLLRSLHYLLWDESVYPFFLAKEPLLHVPREGRFSVELLVFCKMSIFLLQGISYQFFISTGTCLL